MASSIKTTLDLDISRFQSKAQAATKVAGDTIGTGLNRAVERKLGLKDAFKGLVAGVGLNIESISDFIARAFTGMSEGMQKAYEQMAEAGERATAILETQLRRRRTAAQNIVVDTAAEVRLQKELAEIMSRRPMRTEQRFLAGVPVLGEKLQSDMFKNGILTPKLEERANEIKTQLQEIAVAKEEAANLQKDQERATRNSEKAIALAGGERTANAELAEIIRQKRDLEEEFADKETSAARKAQLQLEINKLDLTYLQKMRAETDALRDANARIADLRREKKSVGDTKAEQIRDMEKERDIIARRSADRERTEVDRRQQKILLAQKELEIERAKYSLALSLYERTKISLADAAARKAGTPTEQAQARRVVALEKRATAVRNHGGTFSGVSAEDYAQGLLQRADTLRLGMTGLKLSDRDPFGRSIGKLNDIDAHLAKIESSLAVVSTP